VRSRHYNWVEYLSPFQFELNYVPGESDAISDALSRPRREKELSPPNVVTIQEVKAKTKIYFLRINQKMKTYRVQTSTKWGHPGTRGTRFACLQNFEFQQTRSQVKDIVKRCQRCQKFKSEKK
jgi:Integrase zinc binding domain